MSDPTDDVELREALRVLLETVRRDSGVELANQIDDAVDDIVAHGEHKGEEIEMAEQLPDELAKLAVVDAAPPEYGNGEAGAWVVGYLDGARAALAFQAQKMRGLKAALVRHKRDVWATHAAYDEMKRERDVAIDAVERGKG